MSEFETLPHVESEELIQYFKDETAKVKVRIKALDELKADRELNGDHVDHKIPDWTTFYLTMAFLVSKRSSDAQTQHGCVITDKHNRVLGVGYNGFPRSMPDHLMPNMRPGKYLWVLHSERNALANCTLRPEGGIAYITGQPCFECAKAMYQEGISKFVCAKRHGSFLVKEDEIKAFHQLIALGGIEYSEVEFPEPHFDFGGETRYNGNTVA